MTPTEFLLNLGADAHQNMFDVYYQDGDTEFQLSGRIDGFTPPNETQQTHKIEYQGQSVDLPSPKVEQYKKIQLTFRLDSNYIYYGKWKARSRYHGRASSGGAVSNVAVNNGTLKIVALKGAYLGINGVSTENGTKINGTLRDGTENSNYATTKEFATENAAQGITSSGSDTICWEFRKCWVGPVTEPQFKTSDASAQTFQVTVYFADSKYPFE